MLTGVYAASRRIVGLGMGCKDPGEIYERWRHAVDKPIDPVVVESGPARRGSRRCGAGGNRTVDATGTGGGARLSGDTRVTGRSLLKTPRAASATLGCIAATFGRPIVCWPALVPRIMPCSITIRAQSGGASLFLWQLFWERFRTSIMSRRPICPMVGRVVGGRRDKTKARGAGALQNRAARSPG